MDIKKANTNFRIEDLVDPTKKINKDAFQIDYLPMWHMLDNWERKLPNGFKDIEMKIIFEKIYEFATILISLDKADYQTRIDNLTEQNITWHTKAMNLEAELAQLKHKHQENPFTKQNS